jgi:hypothetical protein
MTTEPVAAVTHAEDLADEYVRFDEDPPMAEEVQELGREGVAVIKRWLEATTFLELSYDIYDRPQECIVPYFGGRKRFDLAGRYMTGDRNRVVVECKRYRSAGGQAAEFAEFLRIAYSATLKDIEHFGRDRETHFYWVTYHPFSQTKWRHLERHATMRAALEANPKYLGGSEIDDDRLRQVASRVSLLVFNAKQEALSLTPQELNLIRTVLDRG